MGLHASLTPSRRIQEGIAPISPAKLTLLRQFLTSWRAGSEPLYSGDTGTFDLRQLAPEREASARGRARRCMRIPLSLLFLISLAHYLCIYRYAFQYWLPKLAFSDIINTNSMNFGKITERFGNKYLQHLAEDLHAECLQG